MSKQIELNLTQLLPSVSLLPPELIHLANSLLAQSRAKAGSLKGEEEIGRTYACCHIACQKLGNRLALDIAKPSPPVKPRVYQKLHAYLNTVLKTTSAPNTPRARRVVDKDAATPRSARSRPSASANATPTLAKTAATPTTLGKRSRGASEKSAEVELPRYTMNLIRHICKELDTPDAVPHVFAGVESAYADAAAKCITGEPLSDTPSKRRRTAASTSTSTVKALARTAALDEDDIAAVVVTAYQCMLNKLYDLDFTGTKDENRTGDRAITAATHFLAHALPPGSVIVPSHAVLKETVDSLHKLFTDMHETEWYRNIPHSGAVPLAAEPNRGSDIGSDDLDERLGLLTPTKPSKTPLRRKEKQGPQHIDDGLGAAGLQIGLGTMFQTAVDWLSHERRADCARWEKDVRRQIAAGGA